MSTNNFDLTSEIVSNLDRHLAIAYLNIVNDFESKVYSEKSLLKAQYDLCVSTKLFADAVELCEDIFTGPELEAKKAELKKKIDELSSTREAAKRDIAGVQQYFAKVATPEGQRLFKTLVAETRVGTEGMGEFGFDEKKLKEVFAFARNAYEYGLYAESERMLNFVRSVDPINYRHNENRLWGQLACSILCCIANLDAENRTEHTWKDTLGHLSPVWELIDSKPAPLGSILYFLHWSLFVFLWSGLPNGRDAMLEYFLNEKIQAVIVTSAQHLMRYVCVAVLTSKETGPRRKRHQALAHIFKADSWGYHDPIVDVVIALLVKSDTKAALAGLSECEKVFAIDPFIKSAASDFMDAARKCCFEDVCRVHREVDIQKVALSLGMGSDDQGEKWLVNIIRGGRINAKVDTNHKKIRVESEITIPNAATVLMEKTRALRHSVQALYKTCNDAAAAVQTANADVVPNQ